jgi:hypothetical protein
MRLKLIALAVAAIVLAPVAFADTIYGLKNTGAGFSANAQDTSYALSVIAGSTSGLGDYGYVADMSGWPDAGPWIGSGKASKWLTPTVDEGQSFDPSVTGKYSWKLNFDLTGFNQATASFSGQWAADNVGVVKLNGTQIGSSNSFSSWSAFSANSGFLSGINTLEFLVTNTQQAGGNPTGLRVEFATSAVAAVPEPETYAMLLVGLGLMGTIARRRKQQ